MFTREGVTEEKWYKDQVRLYGLLNELSKKQKGLIRNFIAALMECKY